MTTITRFRPIDGFLTLPRELDRWVDEALSGWGRGENLRSWYPMTDVSETPEHLVLRLEVPGMSREDIKLSVENNVLTVRGEKRQAAAQENENWYRTERTYGAFERSFSLPTHVNPDAVRASLESGVLTIKLPRREEARPREIQIEGQEGSKQIKS